MILHLILFITLVSSIDANSEDERNLEGKNVIITGAARGIGYAIADNYLNAGVNLLIILDKNMTNGIRAAESLNCKYGEGKVIFIPCDVTKDLYLFDQIIEEYGPINVFVNNAGLLDEYQPRETMLTNAVAPVQWMLQYLKHVRKDRGGIGGNIVVTASRSGYRLGPFMITYVASKHASLAFAICLGHPYNYKITGLRVVALNPELTATAMTLRQTVWDEQVEDYNKFIKNATWQQPDAVGKAARYVFENAESGTAWKVADGIVSESPTYLYVSEEELEEAIRSY